MAITRETPDAIYYEAPSSGGSASSTMMQMLPYLLQQMQQQNYRRQQEQKNALQLYMQYQGMDPSMQSYLQNDPAFLGLMKQVGVPMNTAGTRFDENIPRDEWMDPSPGGQIPPGLAPGVPVRHGAMPFQADRETPEDALKRIQEQSLMPPEYAAASGERGLTTDTRRTSTPGLQLEPEPFSETRRIHMGPEGRFQRERWPIAPPRPLSPRETAELEAVRARMAASEATASAQVTRQQINAQELTAAETTNAYQQTYQAVVSNPYATPDMLLEGFTACLGAGKAHEECARFFATEALEQNPTSEDVASDVGVLNFLMNQSSTYDWGTAARRREATRENVKHRVSLIDKGMDFAAASCYGDGYGEIFATGNMSAYNDCTMRFASKSGAPPTTEAMRQAARSAQTHALDLQDRALTRNREFAESVDWIQGEGRYCFGCTQDEATLVAHAMRQGFMLESELESFFRADNGGRYDEDEWNAFALARKDYEENARELAELKRQADAVEARHKGGAGAGILQQHTDLAAILETCEDYTSSEKRTACYNGVQPQLAETLDEYLAAITGSNPDDLSPGEHAAGVIDTIRSAIANFFAGQWKLSGAEGIGHASPESILQATAPIPGFPLSRSYAEQLRTYQSGAQDQAMKQAQAMEKTGRANPYLRTKQTARAFLKTVENAGYLTENVVRALGLPSRPSGVDRAHEWTGAVPEEWFSPYLSSVAGTFNPQATAGIEGDVAAALLQVQQELYRGSTGRGDTRGTGGPGPDTQTAFLADGGEFDQTIRAAYDTAEKLPVSEARANFFKEILATREEVIKGKLPLYALGLLLARFSGMDIGPGGRRQPSPTLQPIGILGSAPANWMTAPGGPFGNR